jgi:hypothetical protein
MRSKRPAAPCAAASERYFDEVPAMTGRVRWVIGNGRLALAADSQLSRSAKFRWDSPRANQTRLNVGPRPVLCNGAAPRRPGQPRKGHPGSLLRFGPAMIPHIFQFLIAALLAAPAGASPNDNEQYARLPESVQRVEHETGGKVLQVKPIQRGDREIYRMKVLTPDGRVKVVQDDPRHPRGSSTRDPRRAAEREADDSD